MSIARARFITVLLLLAAGALLLIASTQTWFVVTLRESPDTPLDVAGADAVPVLAPLALAALALAGATSIAGRVLSYVASALAVMLGGALTLLLGAPATGEATGAVSPRVTEATGIAGADAVASLVRHIDATAWPVIALVLSVLLTAIGLFAALTAHSWNRAGRRYRTSTAPAREPRGAGRDARGVDPSAGSSDAAPEQLDSIDSWDDLTHGADPTR